VESRTVFVTMGGGTLGAPVQNAPQPQRKPPARGPSPAEARDASPPARPLDRDRMRREAAVYFERAEALAGAGRHEEARRAYERGDLTLSLVEVEERGEAARTAAAVRSRMDREGWVRGILDGPPGTAALDK